jgi:hypothetical protein
LQSDRDSNDTVEKNNENKFEKNIEKENQRINCKTAGDYKRKH